MQCKGLHDITIQSLFSSYFWAIKAAMPQVGLIYGHLSITPYGLPDEVITDI